MARLADYFIVVGYDHEKTGRCGCAQRCPAVPGRSPRSCPAPAPARLRPGRGRRRLRRTRGARPAGGGGGEGSGASQGLIPLSRGGEAEGLLHRPAGAAPARPARWERLRFLPESAGRFKRGPRPCPGSALAPRPEPPGRAGPAVPPPVSRRLGRDSRASRENKGCRGARRAAGFAPSPCSSISC